MEGAPAMVGERRVGDRFSGDGYVHVDMDGRWSDAKVLNVSAGGALLALSDDAFVGMRATLAAPTLPIRVSGTVMRCDARGTALRFDDRHAGARLAAWIRTHR